MQPTVSWVTNDYAHCQPLQEWMTPALQNAGLVVTQLINEGSFGTVLKGKRLTDGLWVAVKVVSKSGLSEREHATLRKQGITLRALRHRYIVDFYDDFEDDDFFYHVFEFLQGGDLYDRLEARGKPFSESQVLFLARQLFYAVSYLHSKRAAHRDIKLENFVFETAPSDRRQVMKLIDFDLLVVRSAAAPQTELCNDICGTIYYVSPEIAAAREHVPEQSDMWACGVMLYVLITYHMPFQGSTGRDILKAVRTTEPHFNPAVWAFVSVETRQLVKDLLNKSGAARPTAYEALERVKAIQAAAKESQRRSKLRALTRGIRSVSLNVWDPSGRVIRRTRAPSAQGMSDGGEASTRRSRSYFPGEEPLSAAGTMRNSYVPLSGTSSDNESARLLARNRPQPHQLFGYNSALALPNQDKGLSEEQRAEGSRVSSEFQTSPTLGSILAKKRTVQHERNKNELPQLQAVSPLRSSRRLKKQNGFAMRIKNWIHLR